MSHAFSRLLGAAVLAALAAAQSRPAPPASRWVRAGIDGVARPAWGLRGGLLFSLYPANFRKETDGPRGLIRIAFPTLARGGAHPEIDPRSDLVNYLAIEPVVKGKRGFSELETSAVDGKVGLSIVPESADKARAAGDALAPGVLRALPGGVEELEVTFHVEAFRNGARVDVIATQRSDAPNEVELTLRARPGSAPIEQCIVTATMGNFARARRLALRGSVATTAELFPGLKGTGFSPHATFPLAKLIAIPATGDVVAAITTDEKDPLSVRPFPPGDGWYYGGAPVTQYWRKPRGTFRDDLEAAVNARATYWQSETPIPGGPAFENFELRERFVDGQRIVFGVTSKTPGELGWK